jgi:hypothetical protein
MYIAVAIATSDRLVVVRRTVSHDDFNSSRYDSSISIVEQKTNADAAETRNSKTIRQNQKIRLLYSIPGCRGMKRLSSLSLFFFSFRFQRRDQEIIIF